MSTKTLKAKTKAVLAETDSDDGINHDWVVTNNSTQEVVILDLYNDGKSIKETVYEQGITKLNTKDGKTSIAAASASSPTQVTISLTDKHNNVPVTVYEIVFANASNLFPVKSTSVGLTYPANPDDDATFAAQSIDAKATDYMTDSANFVRTIIANPSSKLATGFTQAVQDATSASKTSAAVDAALATWFKNNTDGFKNVTLDAIAAVQSYMTVFPHEWLDYKSQKIYYLYTSDGKTVTAQGKLTLQQMGTVTSPDKSLTNFQFIFLGAGKTVGFPLRYYKGQFVDNADMPNICLQGTFVVKSLLSNVDTDTEIISILTGTVYGHKVIGSDIEQHITDPNNPDDQWSGLYGLLHPTDAMGLVTLAMTFAGLSAFFKDLVLAPLKALKDLLFNKEVEKKGQEPTDAESDEIKKNVTELVDEFEPVVQNGIYRLGAVVDVKINYLDTQKNVIDSISNTINEMKRSSMLDELKADNNALVEAAKYQDTDDIQQASYDAYQTTRTIERVPVNELSPFLPQAEPTVVQITTDTATAVNAAVVGAPAAIIKAVDAGKQAAQDAAVQRKALDDQGKQIEDGDAPEGKAPYDPFKGGDD